MDGGAWRAATKQLTHTHTQCSRSELMQTNFKDVEVAQSCPALCNPIDCCLPGSSIQVGFHFLLQGIFLTQGSNPGLLHCRQTFYHLSHQGNHYESKDFLKGKDLYQVEMKMDGLEGIKLQKKVPKVIFTCAPQMSPKMCTSNVKTFRKKQPERTE